MKKAIRFVVVRSRGAGVWAGDFVEREGNVVTLANAIRLWFWTGASLSQVASEGPSDPIRCKFGLPVPRVEILDTVEIQDTTATAAAGIKGVVPWRK